MTTVSFAVAAPTRRDAIARDKALAIIIGAAESHLEDLETGVADGIYDSAENAAEIAQLTAALALLTDSPVVEEEETEQQYLNHYTCPRCKHEWTDQWSATCDDDCPSCGHRHISPTHSDDIDC